MEYLWWQEAVLYQIYPRSYMDSNGDGIGDLAGIISKLDYLAYTLEVDAIWLSPFYPSPMADFGYDVADYTDVDPMFGTLSDFDALVKGAHERDIKVIIDWVPNHSSSQHPWFIESRSSRDNPKRDWYVWKDPAPDGSPPNNWISVFRGPAWTFDEITGQYYLHSYLSEQPDLNWRNPETRQTMLETLRFWMRRGVDGFRLDACHKAMKDPLYRSNPVLNTPRPGYKNLGEYDSLIHIHDQGHPDIHDLFREVRSVLDEFSSTRPRFSVGEIHLEGEEWASYYGNGDELHMPYNFGLLMGDWSAAWVRSVVDTQERLLPPGAWPNFVLGNHDEVRFTTRLGEKRARLATLMLLTLRGTPTLYYGDELGMLQADIPPEEQQDPWGRRQPGLGRDGCRTPMQWNAEEHGGFTSGRPWLKTLDADGSRNVAAQLSDPDSFLNLTRHLIRLRKGSVALRRGSYQPIEGLPEAVFAYQRLHPDETRRVYLNFGAEPVRIATEGEVVAAIDRDIRVEDGELVLGGLGGAVLS
ncbi:MAG: DUF3459 domain-containing protein [Acidimicrobiia bacterium]|nr:alpha-amylase family glycosyl hydrolase [bacterium]MXX64012.1 DUF3459 domain-containing protein [Acidimicrobiia bacterium]MCY3579498.1 alpha-amylase family glycosyl hydrolase [bacterium]MCY3652257.1 alpha-amylase family glycosyl hydrolase [bacterium]MDE0643455.1 alpha-amylase family glycosyl hydrolase [bacterium]